MKRIISILLCTVLISSFFVCASATTLEKTFKSGIYTYKTNNGEATITKIKKNVKGDVVIPAFIDGYLVTCIGRKAFGYRNKIESVTIPDSVTEIKNVAFYSCLRLKTVKIPKSVVTMGEKVFKYSHNLVNIEVDERNDYYYDIDGVLFSQDKTLIKYPAQKKETNYRIPKGIKEIEELAFADCKSLKKVTIPDSVESIGRWAFEDCSQLKSIKISKNLTKIGKGAFLNTKYYNQQKNWKNNFLYIDNYLIDAGTVKGSCKVKSGTTLIADYAFNYDYDLTDVIIPEGVTIIGEGAFYYCDNLKSITLPESLTKIGDFAFYSFNKLKKLSIPKNVEEIGKHAFYYCRKLTEIKVDEENAFYCDVDGVLFNKEKTELIKYPNRKKSTVYELPPTVTNIPKEAFQTCKKIKSIVIPNSVTKIGTRAFNGCTSLKSVALSINLKRIGNSAFYNCTALTEIIIPDSVTKIGKSAFSNCESLTNVKLSNSLTKIAENTFSYCPSLSNIIISEGVTTIETNAFYNCTDLKTVKIPESVTKIGEHAFGYRSTKNNTFVKIKDFHIKGKANSAAQIYAEENGFKFSLV